MKPFPKNRWCMFLLGAMLSSFGISTALALNADLSNWTQNLTGDLIEEEITGDRDPELAVSGNLVHVLWASSFPDYSQALFYKRSTDKGASFGDTIGISERLPKNYLVHGDYAMKRMAVDGNNVHIVSARFNDQGPGHSGWYYTLSYWRSTDGGASFEAPRLLFTSYDSWSTHAARIAARNGRVAIVFDHGAMQIVALHSGDGGSSFQTSVAASGSSADPVGFYDIALTNQGMCILYAGEYGIWPNSRIGISCSVDLGKSFSAQWLSTASADGSYNAHSAFDVHYAPNLAVSGKAVYAVWPQNDCCYSAYAGDQNAVYFSRSGDGGLNFSEPVKLSGEIPAGTVLKSGQETLAVQADAKLKTDRVYVLFVNVNSGMVYLKRSADGGLNFTPMQELGYGWWPLVQASQTLPAGKKSVHVLWNPCTYRKSTDNGATFTGSIDLSPQFSWNEVREPQMAMDAKGNLHCVVYGAYYANGAAGDDDVFYRKYSPAPSPSQENQALKLHANRTARIYDNMGIAASKDINFTTAMTLEAWVRLDDWNLSSGYFLLKSDPGTASIPGSYALGIWDDGRADARILTASGTYRITSAEPLTPGVWTHLAVTYQAGSAKKNFRLYVNGQLSGSAVAGGAILTDGAPLFVGGGSNVRYYNEISVDDLSLWNRALTGKQIVQNMKAGLSGKEPGLRAYYNFNGTTRDITGHKNDGVLLYQEQFVAGPASPVGLDDESLLVDLDAGR